jgi:hypothetical protein
LTIFDEVVLPKKDKWERLFAVLSTSQFQNAEPVATRLVQCTAPDDRERAARCILEAVKCVTGGTSLIGPLERLDCRSLIPKMRELLFAAPTHTAGDLAILLAKWKDSASAPAIRELIQYQGERLSRLPEVLLGLYELEGAPSAECLAECIRLLPPASKKWVLTQWNGDPHCRVAIRAIAELPLRNLLRELAGETEDPEVKKAATALLAKAEGQT